MNSPINLNRVRKQKSRAAKKKLADENARKHGRSKAERLLDATRSQKAANMLDAHFLDESE